MLIQRPKARGPAPRLTAHLVGSLRRLGCHVVTHPWGQHRAGESLLQKLRQRPRDVLSVHRALQNQSFDVAVVNTAHDWRTLLRDVAVVLVIRRHCRPVVLQLHGSLASTLVQPGSRALKLATAMLLALVDGLMVLSSEEKAQWRAFRRRPPAFTVTNPYVSVFPPSTSEMTGLSRSGHRVLFVGRLVAAKGIFELVDAFVDVLEQTQCKLIIVGEGGQEQELRDRILDRGIQPHVAITGYLSGGALIDQYRDASVFVLPSWSEGFPTVITEAMDAGLPIVTTGIHGAADHLVDGENALFVPPRDAKALSAAIIHLLHNPELRGRMGAKNREHITRFAPEIIAAEYLDVLRAIVHSDSPLKRAGKGGARLESDESVTGQASTHPQGDQHR